MIPADRDARDPVLAGSTGVGVIGVVPAAGRARRLGEPTSSKEVEPVYTPEAGAATPQPVCYRLLDAFAEAGIGRAIAVTRPEKRDLALALASRPGPPGVEVIQVDDSPSAPFTISVATRAAGAATVALGFPDVLWTGERAFERLIDRLAAGADAVLGLFPPPPDYPTAGVVCSPVGRVERLVPPPEVAADAKWPAWTLAVWTPRFSRHLERVVERVVERGGGPIGAGVEPRAPIGPAGPKAGAELGMSAVVQSAITAGLDVVGMPVSDRVFLDIGEPSRLARARGRLS